MRGSSNIRFSDVELFNQSDVDHLVARQMGHKLQNSSQLQQLRADLEPIFRTLASPSGGLSHQATRYALFRFFLNERSWLVKGLEPEGSWKTQPERLRRVWESWVPSYLQKRFEQAKHGEGASLEDLVEIAAIIEDLVRQESQKQMAKVFESLGLPLQGVLSREEVNMATDMYLLVVLTAQNLTLAEPERNRRRLHILHQKTDLYAAALAWLRHLEDRILKEHDGGYRLSSVSKVAEAFGLEFPSFNDKECSDLKAQLVSMEGGSRKPGRIPLTDFYRSSAYRHWTFSESPEYLRDLGVLDESDPHRPHVILANYIASYNNCMRTDGLYAICCRSLCGDMMSAIEQQVLGPAAGAPLLAGLVAGLAGTEGLDPKLRQRLDGIAAQSGGQVPLHGRLFAQFLHHAFPRDCPYPHEAGTTNPQTPDDWVKTNGRSTMVSQEQLEQLARDTCPADVHHGNAPSYCQSEDSDLPWSNSEDREDLLNVPERGSATKPPHSEPSYQAIAENLPPSRLLAWLMTFPAFVVVAHVLDTLLGRGTLRQRYPAVAPALVFLWLAMMCVALDLIDIRAAVGAAMIFLNWRIFASRFLHCPVGNKTADLEV